MSGTHWKKLTNPNYLGSWDFNPGEERVLTINRVTQEEVFNPTDNTKKFCIIAYFNENSKPMVLNKTNCKTIQALHNTPIIEEWAGKRIAIEVKKVKAFGKLEEALRVKKSIPNEKSKQAQIPPCNDCGGNITDYEGYTALQIRDATFSRYGFYLCGSCSRKRKLNDERKKSDDSNS